jgi:hypothetical protein
MVTGENVRSTETVVVVTGETARDGGELTIDEGLGGQDPNRVQDVAVRVLVLALRVHVVGCLAECVARR